jgi:hypothetical protein
MKCRIEGFLVVEFYIVAWVWCSVVLWIPVLHWRWHSICPQNVVNCQATVKCHNNSVNISDINICIKSCGIWAPMVAESAYWLDYRMDKWGSVSGRGKGLIFHMMYQLGVWPTHFLIQWIPVALFPLVKQPGDRAFQVSNSVEGKIT